MKDKEAFDKAATPELVESFKARSEILLRIIDAATAKLYGPHYKATLILAANGDPNSLAILSVFDTEAEMHTILKSAANRCDTGEMVCEADLAMKGH